MDTDQQNNQNEFDTLSRLKLQLEEQDTLIRELRQRSPDALVSAPQISTVQSIFSEVNALRTGLLPTFIRTSTPDGLRSQIRSARARLDQEINLLNSLPASPGKTENNTAKPDPRRVFVVHGRNPDARKAIFDFLSRINLDPIEWEEAIAMTASTSPSTSSGLSQALKLP
jgi:hypothetical protein